MRGHHRFDKNRVHKFCNCAGCGGVLKSEWLADRVVHSQVYKRINGRPFCRSCVETDNTQEAGRFTGKPRASDILAEARRSRSGPEDRRPDVLEESLEISDADLDALIEKLEQDQEKDGS